MKKVAILFIVCCTLLQNCAVNPVSGKKEFMLMSKDQEVAMGQQADPDIVASFGLYPDETLQRFINEKGQAMVKISHRPDLKYEFKILDSPVVNAFAVPGGYVYFTRGIMAQLNSEAEFAGVLGHEIGHITARHSARQYSRAMAAQLGLAVGSIVSPEFAQFSDLAQTGTSLLFLKFGRDAERQSDDLGVQYSTRIGYDAKHMASFFNVLKRMQQTSGQEIPTFLSTHPDPGERNEKVLKLAEQEQQKTKQANFKVNRNTYLQMIDGIIYGEDPKQGYVDDQTFFHPVLKFRFPIPDKWRIENTPQQVNMASSAGDAMIIFGLEKGSSLQQAGNALAEKYGLKVSSAQNGTINGFSALRMLATQTSQSQQLAIVIHLIQDGDKIYDFIAVTTPQNFPAFEPVANRVAQGFERLTDPARINVEPQRIQVEEVRSGTSLRDALTSRGVAADKLEEHAVLNGMELKETVPSGTLIKIISSNAALVKK